MNIKVDYTPSAKIKKILDNAYKDNTTALGNQPILKNLPEK